ncbi:glycosyltransferase [Aeromicrobium sp. Marseille-Q0843]|uniref:Glycosyltransferase n=1 Tax=Aeromicrobium phoceense TaxID=2754045 RepID=A0A838XS21_9ACTN|nr:glycosyltransferase [Aeromicrobium phoceense]MBA4609864.1 glycosyltransferase [Aeromicrobium phoceense]
MKIAMVSEHANPLAVVGGVDAGGQNVHVDALSTALVARGHEVTVFTRRDSTSAPTRVLAPGGYEVHHVPAGPPADVPKDELWQHMPAFASRMAEVWQRERYDLAHAHFWMSGSATRAAARRVGLPWAMTFHALGSVKRRHQAGRDTSPPGRIDVERGLCATADVVIATCRDEVRELMALGMPRSKARIIPCGVDVRRFPATEHSVPGRRLLAVGRLVERKGLADAVTALAQIPDATLTVAGGPSADALELDPEVQRVRALARGLGCEDRLDFLGAVGRDRLPEVMSAADIVVVAPWYEPFGIVPLEAMSSGRPVVGTAVGGLLDTVVPGRTGELVAPRDPDALAAVLRQLLDDPRRIRRYGRAGAQRARSLYTWDHVARATEDALAPLLSRVPQEVTP